MGRQFCLVTWVLSSVLLYRDVGVQGIMCASGLVPAPCDFPFPGFECFSASFICDGSPLCPNGEEEANCTGVFSCADSEAPCHADPGLSCIPTTQYCDGIPQCPGGTDEYCEDPITTVAPTENGTVIPPITFLPFGVGEGDTETLLTAGEQNRVGPLELSVPIVFYNSNLTSLYASRFGLISPSDTLNGVTRPIADFPRNSDPRIPLIAPLWVEYATKQGLRVLHRVTEDTETLELVARMISERNSELSDYQPSLAVIVTLENPMIGLHGGDYTHQTVLSTDGKASFAAFIYNKPDDVRGIFVERSIGFDAGTSFQGVTVSPSNLQRVNIFRIDGNCVTGIGSDQVCGLNSISTGCSPTDNLTTVDCLCNPGVNNTAGCETDVEFTCPAGAVHVPMCSEEYSVCVPSEIACNGFVDCAGNRDEAPDLCRNRTRFIPFGTVPGDRNFPITSVRSDDLGEDVHLDTPVVIYRQKVKEVFFSTNGLITFNDEFASGDVVELPRMSRPLVPLLAPLWTDINRGGELFARLFSDQETLSTVKQMLLRHNPTLTDYNPSQALVATWHMAELADGTTLTYQAVVSTDGRASFAAFIYEEGGADKIQTYMEDKVVGFDAGDKIRAALVHSLEFSSLGNLSDMNVFRIDGHCVTTAYPGEVCDLDSYAVGCDVNGLTATACRCYETVDLNTTSSNCDVNASFVCEEGSVPSICPGGGDDSPYLGCFPNDSFCNLASDCPGGIDEANCTDYGFVMFGEGAGDKMMKGRRGFTNLTLSMPIVYYQEEELQVFVSTDGFLSFRDEFSGNKRTPFPIDGAESDVPMIAALWAGFSFTTEGVVYSRVTDDPTMLTEVSEMITEANPDLSGYEPSTAVIVTWFLAQPGKDDSNDSVGVYQTFQTVISTDGNVSFAAFIYNDPDSVNAIVEYDHQVGFNAGDRNRGINIAGKNDIEAVYIREDVQGVNIFRVDGSCITSVMPGEVCGLEAVATECRENSVEATVCECAEGYIYQANKCIDDDECVGNAAGCDPNAECLNTEGSFLCTCNAGYSGDGFTCSELPLPASTLAGIIVSIVVVFLIASSIVITLILIMRRREVKKHRERLMLARTESEKEFGNNEYFRRLKQMSVNSKLSLDVPKTFLVNSCNLQLGKTIGQGEFGIVYKALLKKGFTEGYSETVAVKTLKGFLNEELVDDLLKECTKMQNFDHPNVLPLIGVCLDGGPAPYIIMPFMTNGSLLSHLKENRDSLIVDPSSTDLDDVCIVQKKLLDMCIQVAKGMEYLASQRVIHRDLAARNCMIDAGFVIKVADFGLSESIDTSKNYFRKTEGDTIKLPIKWLAIESINDGIFSEKTDVWAYGVTCWEVFSGGKTPYPGIHPLELSRQLEAGDRMKKPLNAACSDEVYNTVLSCWDQSPDSRPTFSDLVRKLTASLSNVADYFDLVVSRPSSSMAVGNCDEFETTVRVLNGSSHSRRESVTSL